MLKRREDLSNIIVAIDDLAKHPPDTPMERLRAALLIAEANEVLADAADGEERLRRRTMLPDGYHLLHPRGDLVVTFRLLPPDPGDAELKRILAILQPQDPRADLAKQMMESE